MPNPPSRKGRDAWCQMILETKVLELKKDCYEAGHQKMEDCVACVKEEQYRAHVQFYISLNSDIEVEALFGDLLTLVVNPENV